MSKKVISLVFIYSRESKNYHVYNLAGEHEFFPKKVYVSSKDMKDPVNKITLNIIIGEDEK